MENKYVVFKRADWNRFLLDLYPPDHDRINAMIIPDAVIIRHQDIFASTALFNYAETIRTCLMVMEEMGVDNQYTHQLELLADYFAEQASIAQSHAGKKFPD